MLFQFLLFLLIVLTITNDNNSRICYEQRKLWFYVYTIYTIITLITDSFVNDPTADYFINSDQAGYYQRSLSLWKGSVLEILKKSFTLFRYSEMPLISAYFPILMKWAQWMGVDDLLLFVKLNTAFIGSLIPVYVYKIIRLYDYESGIVKKIFVFTIVSPIMLLSCQMMRDVHICLLYTIMVYYVLKPKQVLRWVIFVIIITSIYYLRVENGIFTIAFIAVFLYREYEEGKTGKRMFILSISLIGLVLSAGIILDSMTHTIGSYTVRSIRYANEASLGVKLNSLPFPFNYLSKTAFGQLLPFPIWLPMSYDEPYSFIRILECPFPFYWLPIMACLSYIGWYYRNVLDNTLLSLLIVSFLYIIVSSASEFNTRRIMAVYPILFSLYSIWDKQVILPKYKMTYLSIELIIGLHLIYLAIKII